MPNTIQPASSIARYLFFIVIVLLLFSDLICSGHFLSLFLSENCFSGDVLYSYYSIDIPQFFLFHSLAVYSKKQGVFSQNTLFFLYLSTWKRVFFLYFWISFLFYRNSSAMRLCGFSNSAGRTVLF